MTMPMIGLHMIPEEADLGPDAQLIDTGTRIELIRFGAGMGSGKTAIGVAIPLTGIEDTEFGEPIFEGNTWAIAQTSLTALRAAVRALDARDEAEGRPQ